MLTSPVNHKRLLENSKSHCFCQILGASSRNELKIKSRRLLTKLDFELPSGASGGGLTVCPTVRLSGLSMCASFACAAFSAGISQHLSRRQPANCFEAAKNQDKFEPRSKPKPMEACRLDASGRYGYRQRSFSSSLQGDS